MRGRIAPGAMNEGKSAIWIVSELYHPEETSTGYFLTRIAEGLARRYPVRVLCGQPTYAARGIRAPRREIRDGVFVERCSATCLAKDVMLFRVINWITISLSFFLHAVLRFGRGDRVLVVTNPPTLPFLILLGCRLRGAKCVLLVHDVYPDILIALRVLAKDALHTRLAARGVRWLYAGVDRIVVLGRDMYALVCQRLGADHSKVIIVPNWADVDDILPGRREDNPLLRGLGLDKKFVIQYSGNMGRTHGIELLVEAARRLQDCDGIHFLLIGWGGKKRWLEKAVSREGLKNVTVLDYLPREELSGSLNACDVAVVALIPGMMGVSVPSRMYNILAAGKPIIAITDEGSELARMIQEEGVGWVVPTDQADRFMETLLLAEERQSVLALMGERARGVAERKYTFAKAISGYYALMEGLDGDTSG